MNFAGPCHGFRIFPRLPAGKDDHRAGQARGGHNLWVAVRVLVQVHVLPRAATRPYFRSENPHEPSQSTRQ